MPENENKRDYKWLIWAGAALVVIGLFCFALGPGKHWFFNKLPVASKPNVAGPTAAMQTDPICQYVVGIGLKCVQIPAEEGLMGLATTLSTLRQMRTPEFRSPMGVFSTSLVS
jgi:hypothetical protein